MSRLARVRPFLRPATRHFSTSPLGPLPWAPLPMGPPKVCIPNGAMRRGPNYFTDTRGTDNGAIAWSLMPGVSKENVTVKVVGNQIFFHGIEVLDVPGYPGSEDEILREYKGSFLVDPDRFDAEKVKAEIVNGVFWIHVPNCSH